MAIDDIYICRIYAKKNARTEFKEMVIDKDIIFHEIATNLMAPLVQTIAFFTIFWKRKANLFCPIDFVAGA